MYYLTDQRERYGDTISGLGDKSKRKNLRFGVFDVVHLEKLLSNFEDKYNFLKKTIGLKTKESSHVLEHKKIKQNEISKLFKNNVEKNNSEGLIIRNDNSIYKIKKKKQEIY